MGRRNFVSMYAGKMKRLPERKAVEVKVFDNASAVPFTITAHERRGWGVVNHGKGKLSLVKPDGTYVESPTAIDVEAMHQCYQGDCSYRVAQVTDAL